MGVAVFFIVRMYFHARVDREPNKARQREVLIWKRTLQRVVGVTEEENKVRYGHVCA